MIDVFPRDTLGHSQTDWLDAYHHFSFADYHDPARINFGALRVWNDDLFRPGGGFPLHPHRDMEIITFVTGGTIAHEDSLGNVAQLAAGGVQVMTAGSGIVHSEFNSGDDDLTLFQIWLLPEAQGLSPRWQNRDFAKGQRRGRLVPLVSRHGDNNTLQIYQDATLLAADLKSGETVSHDLAPGRRAYVVAVAGAISVNGVAAPAKAGVQVTEQPTLNITAQAPGEVVVLDLA